mmetsp:Transcript_34968/g.83477  ORF Transcript_34968/g.83477 Transcript_34968/m.83477 type:complete len:227 (-) Transcript_34968:338-1018(-)
MRSPPALPRQGPAPASTAPWPPRGRAVGARLRRASWGLEAAAGARQRAAPVLAALLEDGGEGGKGGALLGGNAPLEGGDGSDDASVLGGSALGGGVLDGGALGCGALRGGARSRSLSLAPAACLRLRLAPAPRLHRRRTSAHCLRLSCKPAARLSLRRFPQALSPPGLSPVGAAPATTHGTRRLGLLGPAGRRPRRGPGLRHAGSRLRRRPQQKPRVFQPHPPSRI